MPSDYTHAEQSLLQSILSGDTQVPNRTTLGNTVSIQLFQALRLIALGSSMESMIGDGARALVHRAGMQLGSVLGSAVLEGHVPGFEAYISRVREIGSGLSIGLLSIENDNLDKGQVTLRLDECVSCAGIVGVQAPICNFEVGMIAGIVKVFTKRSVKAIETRCHAIGHDTCAVDAIIV